MSYGADLLQVTEETFNTLKSATAGIDTTTGVAGIDLLELQSWVPCDVPFFESVARGQGKGATAVIFESFVNVNDSQPDGGIPDNEAAPVVNVQNQYVYSPYASVGAGGTVTWDAIAQGAGYADVLAADTLQTMIQQMINLDLHELNAQRFALPATPKPTLTAATTGGTIVTGTVYIKCAARSGMNWFRGGSSAASPEANVAVTGPTGAVTASVAAVKGASGYDWYVGSASNGEFYYTTTAVNTVTVTSVPTVAANIPTGLAGLYHAGQAGPSSVPATDSSYENYWQNGLLASITGDWSSQPDQVLTSGAVANLVTPGSGTTQGSFYNSLNGAQLTVSGAALAEIDDMNRSIYDRYQLTPTRMLMGSQVMNDIANAVLNNPQAVTWLVPTDRQGRAQVVAGGHVGTYLNKTVNGQPIELWLMPRLAPGKIVSLVDRVPFPGANIDVAFQARCQYDFFRFQYGANRQTGVSDGGPRQDFEIRSRQAFVNKVGPLCGLLDNIAPGIA